MLAPREHFCSQFPAHAHRQRRYPLIPAAVHNLRLVAQRSQIAHAEAQLCQLLSIKSDDRQTSLVLRTDRSFHNPLTHQSWNPAGEPKGVQRHVDELSIPACHESFIEQGRDLIR